MVAPRVGAWIETRSAFDLSRRVMSPLAWGRGLKLALILIMKMLQMSPLAWGRGLKHFLSRDIIKNAMSPLAWGRGLKHCRYVLQVFRTRRPSRGGVD